MEEQELRKFVYSAKVVEFVAVAHEFCRLVETGPQYKTPGLADLIRKFLPLLYYKASLLPEMTPLQEDEPEKTVTELDYNVLLQRWSDKLGDLDFYREVFDPDLQFGTEPVTASISENILDIYQDMKDFVTAYSLGDEETMYDAVAVCMRHFGEFWGQRLVNVLRAVHLLHFSLDYSGAGEAGDHPDAGVDPGFPGWVDRFFSDAYE